MYPKLFTIYGPFEVNSYNSALMIGLGLFMYLTTRHPGRAALMSSSAYVNLCIEGALAGILGGRILHILSSLDKYPTIFSMLSIWDGGLSILGAIAGVLLFMAWSLSKQGIPFLALADIAALYAPLFHGIARIGCFLVGCCYGAPTNSIMGVTYTNPQVMAPLHTALHPSQLYSSLIFFGLFFALQWYAKTRTPQRGSILLLYIMGMSLERFIVDFVRGDRILIKAIPHLSFYQVIAAVLFVGAAISIVRQMRVTHESI